jgi:hypothetical protein
MESSVAESSSIASWESLACFLKSTRSLIIRQLCRMTSSEFFVYKMTPSLDGIEESNKSSITSYVLSMVQCSLSAVIRVPLPLRLSPLPSQLPSFPRFPLPSLPLHRVPYNQRNPRCALYSGQCT